MKKSIILDIFNGRRGQQENMFMPKDIVEKNTGPICGLYDELKSKLSPELFELNQKYIDMIETKNVDEVDFYFAEGFKLGLLIGIECSEE